MAQGLAQGRKFIVVLMFLVLARVCERTREIMSTGEARPRLTHDFSIQLKGNRNTNKAWNIFWSPRYGHALCFVRVSGLHVYKEAYGVSDGKGCANSADPVNRWLCHTPLQHPRCTMRYVFRCASELQCTALHCHVSVCVENFNASVAGSHSFVFFGGLPYALRDVVLNFDKFTSPGHLDPSLPHIHLCVRSIHK